MPMCVGLELVIFILKYTIELSQRLPQRQQINTRNKTFELVHNHTELEHKPIKVFQCFIFKNRLCHKDWMDIVSVVFLAGSAIHTALAR